MIPGGYRPTHTAASEVDALQADVMRFVAIIGLCLAAIFSLLRETEPGKHDVAPDSQALEASTVPALPARHVQVQRPDTVRSPPSTPAPDQVEEGFSLSFSSDDALLELLSTGSVAVYAISANQFWRYQVAGQLLEKSAAPSAYHEMDGLTVPARIRQWMVAAGEDVDAWGVVLSADIAGQLQSAMNASDGGELLINRTGEVLAHGRD